jgi:hypothetical protein
MPSSQLKRAERAIFFALGLPFVCSTGNSGHDIGCATPKPFKYEALVEILTRLLSR